MKKEGQNCQAGLVYQSVKNFHPLERQPAIILQTSQIITLYERWHKTILFHHQASLSMQNTEQICSSKISSVKQNNSLMKCVKVLTRWKVILQKQGMVFKFWTQSFWLKHAHCQVKVYLSHPFFCLKGLTNFYYSLTERGVDILNNPLVAIVTWSVFGLFLEIVTIASLISRESICLSTENQRNDLKSDWEK